jgi:hypothetical protein
MKRPATPMRRLDISSSAIATEMPVRRACMCRRVAGPSARERLAQDLLTVILQGCDATAVHGTIRARNLKAEE